MGEPDLYPDDLIAVGPHGVYAICVYEPGRVISDNAEIDPLMHWLRLGRNEAAKWNQSQRLRNLERRQRRF